MQIPPSQAQKVIRGIALRALIGELTRSRFTGHCAMPIAGAVASMVLDEGRCILAEYRGIRGLDALEVIRAIGNPVVDVMISSFSRDEVAAIRKVNQPFSVEPRPEGAPTAGASGSTTVIRPVSIGSAVGKPVKVVTVRTGKGERAPAPAMPAGKGKAPAGHPAAPHGKSDGMDRPLDRKGLESIKSLKETFNAADLLSELNLGHLVVNPPKTDKVKRDEGAEKGDTG